MLWMLPLFEEARLLPAGETTVATERCPMGREWCFRSSAGSAEMGEGIAVLGLASTTPHALVDHWGVVGMAAWAAACPPRWESASPLEPRQQQPSRMKIAVCLI